MPQAYTNPKGRDARLRGIIRLRLFGESADQKFTDHLKSLIGSCEASHAPDKSMDHALPYIETSIDSCRDRALYKPDGISQQHFVIAYVNADWNQAFQVSEEW